MTRAQYIPTPPGEVTIPTAVEAAKGHCTFVEYRSIGTTGELRYRLEWYRGFPNQPLKFQSCTFLFPIPVEDAGGGTFLPEMKGLELLRWIRKYSQAMQAELANRKAEAAKVKPQA